ncbi:DUF3179 domain-containing protein [Halogranum rubrum]|uniref:DUF3179 domain-containing protein n=1 Tax=Halogranum salarium B-1 TaxID=1210908 RepID=J3A6K1_9EURY|nr:DUF3179 domain-containing protein [Halogranum salarium]EJN61128.1 hypothetical protein HSB1_01690 [Halogranum salarium B-1]
MNRRRFLGAVGLAGLAASAGCYEHVRHWNERSDVVGPQPPLSGGDSANDADVALSSNGLHRGAAKDGIPAITDPVFATDWSSVGQTLGEEELVVGLDIGGDARAYPLAILNWHEAVNDVFEQHSTVSRIPADAAFGRPLLVTYCPLCGSSVVTDRTVTGAVRTFGVSGLLWQSGLVLYDVESESLWSQLSATAIRGPLTGTALTRLPSTIATWGEWRREHPTTVVLLPPPASDTVKGWQSRDYGRNPYVGYDRSERVGVGDSRSVDERLHPKTMVVGVASGEAACAYPLASVERRGVVNDTVGTLPVVVAATRAGSLAAYDRRVGGRALDFERDGDELVAGGSRWRLVSGRAVDGPHEGTRLTRVTDYSPLYWFAWANLYPMTDIYGKISV